MKAREVYERALALLSEHESDGANYDTAAFEENAPRLLSLLCVMLDETDLTVRHKEFREEAAEIKTVTTLDDEVYLHPLICAGVLPLGLAFLLIAEENSTLSSLFFSLYQKEKDALIRRFRKARRHQITSVY